MILREIFSCSRMLKVYQKIGRFSEVISYFSTREWEFTNDNTQALWKRLAPSDQQLFRFDAASLDWEDYFATHIMGLRRYLAKDHPSTLPQARKRWFRFYVIHRLIQCVFGFLFLRILWAIFSAVLL
ncbi:hypothetical protein B566_EDAN006375 [Ephemera danica]|nr:hypothetical protein B566_EDAN006375 [Ephemera danica]